jgi:sortase A
VASGVPANSGFMKVVIKKSSLTLFLGWAQRLLLASGVVMLGYYGYVQVDTWMFKQRASQRLEQLAAYQREHPLQGSTDAQVVGPDGLIGRLEIPRLGLSAVLFEGTGNSTLRRAAGHIAGTALPGEPGNVGIAGHRDRLFRPLRNIQQNDIITVTRPGSEYRYRVVSTKIVSPDDVAVLDSDGHESLTLVTCYPFYFVGAAPRRFIVRAERVMDQLAKGKETT